MKHPVYDIAVAFMVAILLISFSALIIHQYNQPLLWWFIISLFVAGLMTLSVSILLYAKKLHPGLKFIRLPFKL